MQKEWEKIKDNTTDIHVRTLKQVGGIEQE